jgi:protein-tyrosine phosphatase
MFQNILVLCLGNICRSPIAEYLLKDFAKKNNLNLNVDSAGITALAGYPAHELSVHIMQEQGIDMTEHRAKQVTAAHVKAADLILVMDDTQRHDLAKMFPQAAGKTFRIGEFTSENIPDPYGEPFTAFEHAFSLIAKGLEPWYAELK